MVSAGGCSSRANGPGVLLAGCFGPLPGNLRLGSLKSLCVGPIPILFIATTTTTNYPSRVSPRTEPTDGSWGKIQQQLPADLHIPLIFSVCRMLADLPSDSLHSYIISMTRTASDVLTVVLLMRECGMADPLKGE